MIRAVLGGSFDPVHNGHVALARRILADDLAHRVHVVPAARNPLKSAGWARADHRLAMTRLAFAGRRGLQVDTLELDRSGPSYTLDTLEALRRAYPDDQLRLIVGQDTLVHFQAWQAPDRLLELAQLVVFSRPRSDDESSPWPPPGVDARPILMIPDFHHEVSSTQIRAMVAAGQSVADLVPPDVLDYIAQHQLYQT